MTDEQLNPVDVLADEFSRRLKAGEAPSVEEYAQKHADHADAIRAMFPSIEVMHRATQKQRSGVELDRRTRNLTTEGNQQLGDFRVIRELGRGGMGIVYLAEQESLRRLVALKVLNANIGECETQLRRFHREAKSAARLHHTNIVPVYGVGEADELHFIAMQYIDGISLEQWLDMETADRTTLARSASINDPTAACLPEAGSPDVTKIESINNDTDVAQRDDQTVTVPGEVLARTDRNANHREAARIVREIARALAYAHEQGVQHRDIKPGNLLIDGDGVPWITDFGLAKHESDEAATKTGDIVGTLRYMAPEQFNGLQSPRSDIHSLGLTLYELLTNQPAYDSGKTVSLMKQKLNEPPTAPRVIDPSVPSDLDIITMKACAIEPKNRYQTAAAFAEDLDRFLQDRPILARRVTAMEQFFRWAKRNPVVAGLSAATLALLVTTATVFAIGQRNTSLALDDVREQKELAEANLGKAQRENARAEKNLDMSISAFNRIMDNIASRGTAHSLAIEVDGEEFESAATVVTSADAEVLETLGEFFELFAQENSTDLSHQTAGAFERLGMIQLRLGRIDDAETSLRSSLEKYASLQSGSAESAHIDQARVHRALIEICAANGDPQTVLNEYRHARRLLSNDRSPETQYELALTQSALVRHSVETVAVIVEAGRQSGGSPRFRGTGGPGRERWGDRTGRGPGRDRDRAPGSPGGRSRRGPGRPEQQNGSRPPFRFGQGRSWQRSAAMRSELFTAAEEAVATLEQLVSSNPEQREYQLELARMHRNRAKLLAGMHEHEADAVESAEAAIENLTALANAAPQVPLYKYELATTLCGPVARNRVQRLVRVAKGVQLGRKLVADYPDVPEYQVLVANALTERYRGQRDNPDGHGAMTEVLNIYRRLHEKFPSSWVYTLTLATRLKQHASQEARADPAEGLKLVEEAIQVLETAGESGGERAFITDFLNRLRPMKQRFAESPPESLETSENE